MYGRVRVRERAHPPGDVWLVVGCLLASNGLDGVLYVFNVHLSGRICGRLMVK